MDAREKEKRNVKQCDRIGKGKTSEGKKKKELKMKTDVAELSALSARASEGGEREEKDVKFHWSQRGTVDCVLGEDVHRVRLVSSLLLTYANFAT